MADETRTASDQGSPAQVGLSPPVVGLGLLALGVVAHLLAPAELLASWSAGLAIGVPLFLIGLAVQAGSVISLRRADTDMLFRAAVSTMMTNGLYARSRNPMYVGILIWNTGLLFAINTLWLVPLPFLLFLYLHLWVIPREERHLAEQFGPQYDAYRGEVRRWV